MEIGNINLRWLGHSGFVLNTGSKTIYIDPYNIPENSEKADIILITHSHYDHCSVADLKKIVKEGTKIMVPADCPSKICRFDEEIDIQIVEPGKEFNIGDLRIITVAAYNIDKSFHPREEGWVGYLIKNPGVVVYHAGDTDVIPEMDKLTGHKQKGIEFIALLPVGGRFTMSFEEAFEAVKKIKPSLAIPMHFGSVVGLEEDAKEFVQMCEEEGVKAKILDKNG